MARRSHPPGWQVTTLPDRGRHPPSLCVPGGPAGEHPNGATGISLLELAASDERAATRSLATLIGAPDASEVSLRLGGCTLWCDAGTGGHGEGLPRCRGNRTPDGRARDGSTGRGEGLGSAALGRGRRSAPAED